jgi:hypothetical protein
VLRRIFESKRDEIIGWTNLHNEELHSLCSSQNIIRNTNLRRIRQAVHVERIGRKGLHEESWWERHKEEDC